MDEARFQAWMVEHLGVLHRIARAFASGEDQHDLLQELMLAVWRAAPNFRAQSALSTFIFSVAHHRALTWQRQERRFRRKQEDLERLDVQASDDPLLERLYNAIRQLPKLDRSLMLLSLEGQSYADIAALHGLTESNVGARLSRTRKNLAQLLENDNEL